MNSQFESFVRTAQTFLPGGSDTKYVIQRGLRRVRRRPFEHDFEAIREFSFADDALLVDVGANRGQSVDALTLVVPNRPIVSFEPNPWLAQGLRRQFASMDNLRIEEVALAELADDFVLFVPFYRGYMFDGLASLDRAEAENWLSDKIIRFNPAKLTIKEIAVKAVTFDSLNIKPSFMKIDVQGPELSVLKGARAALSSCHPKLLVETPSAELVSFLEEYSYSAYCWTGSSFKPGVSASANTFFL